MHTCRLVLQACRRYTTGLALADTVPMSFLGIGIDHAFLWLMLAGALAGWVRGFSGFGAAMVFMPLASIYYPPQLCVVLLFLTDLIVSLPIVLPALPRCRWREVLPLTLGASLLMPAGVAMLLIIEPTVMRWTISLLILASVAMMASGWRWRHSPSVGVTLAVGAASGLAGGLSSLYGPPIIFFWLGGQQDAAGVRDNILAFFAVLTLVSATTYLANGMFTPDSLIMAALLMPGYGLGVLLGARSFRGIADRSFRRFALAMCATAAVAGLPFWH